MNKGRKAAQLPCILVSSAFHHGSVFITNEHTPSAFHFPTSSLSQYSLLHFTFPSLWLDKVPALQLFQAMRVLRVEPTLQVGKTNRSAVWSMQALCPRVPRCPRRLSPDGLRQTEALAGPSRSGDVPELTPANTGYHRQTSFTVCSQNW